MCDKIPLQNPAQILETLQSEQPRMVEFFRLLMLPCSMERDVGLVLPKRVIRIEGDDLYIVFQNHN